MTLFEHPSTRLSEEVVQQLAAYAPDAEIAGDLHPRQMELIYQYNWLKMFVPRNYGGLGLSLPEVIRLEESLAWADGSTAWVITLCAGAGWFIGFVAPSIADEFFRRERMWLAGSGSATGTAEITDVGYRIQGAWPFASGALHATAFTANCFVHLGGKPLLNSDGTPQVLAFIMKPDEVIVKRTWNTTGMVATASHAFSVNNLHVPASRSFEIDAAAVQINDPVYRYPFLQLAETTLAANISGMTVRLLELAAKLAAPGTKMNVGYENSPGGKMIEEKEQILDSRYAEATALHHIKVNDLRRRFFDLVDVSWSQLVGHGEITGTVLGQTSEISHALARECKLVIEALRTTWDPEKSMKGSEMDRVWRNIQTALTHALFRKK